MSANKVFGIDLGTTYSCISQVDAYGRPEVIRNIDGEPTTPSVVPFAGRGRDRRQAGQALVAARIPTTSRSSSSATWATADWRLPRRRPRVVGGRRLLAGPGRAGRGRRARAPASASPTSSSPSRPTSATRSASRRGSPASWPASTSLDMINEPTAAALRLRLRAGGRGERDHPRLRPRRRHVRHHRHRAARATGSASSPPTATTSSAAPTGTTELASLARRALHRGSARTRATRSTTSTPSTTC